MQVRLVGRPPLLNAAVATVSVPMLKNASRKRVGPCHAASVEDGGDADALGVHVCGDCQIPTVLSWLELAPSEARLAWLESLPSDRLSTHTGLLSGASGGSRRERLVRFRGLGGLAIKRCICEPREPHGTSGD